MDARNDQNKLERMLRQGVQPDLSLWSYDLTLQLGLSAAYYRFGMYHPTYGRLLVDEFGCERDLGSATMPYIVSHMWVGATELMERTDQS